MNLSRDLSESIALLNSHGVDQVIRLGREPYRTDILAGLSGVTWKECVDDAVEGDLGGQSV